MAVAGGLVAKVIDGSLEVTAVGSVVLPVSLIWCYRGRVVELEELAADRVVDGVRLVEAWEVVASWRLLTGAVCALHGRRCERLRQTAGAHSHSRAQHCLGTAAVAVCWARAPLFQGYVYRREGAGSGGERGV